jgi:hypothetical protein
MLIAVKSVRTLRLNRLLIIRFSITHFLCSFSVFSRASGYVSIAEVTYRIATAQVPVRSQRIEGGSASYTTSSIWQKSRVNSGAPYVVSVFK